MKLKLLILIISILTNYICISQETQISEFSKSNAVGFSSQVEIGVTTFTRT